MMMMMMMMMMDIRPSHMTWAVILTVTCYRLYPPLPFTVTQYSS